VTVATGSGSGVSADSVALGASALKEGEDDGRKSEQTALGEATGEMVNGIAAAWRGNARWLAAAMAATAAPHQQRVIKIAPQ